MSDQVLTGLIGGGVALLVSVVGQLLNPVIQANLKKRENVSQRLKELENRTELMRALFWRLNEVTGIAIAIVDRYMIVESDVDQQTSENMNRLKVQYASIVHDYEQLFGRVNA